MLVIVRCIVACKFVARTSVAVCQRYYSLSQTTGSSRYWYTLKPVFLLTLNSVGVIASLYSSRETPQLIGVHGHCSDKLSFVFFRVCVTGLALLTLRAKYSICLVLFVHSFDVINLHLLVCYSFNVHLLSVETFRTVTVVTVRVILFAATLLQRP